MTLGLNETFGVTEFEDIRDLTERPGSNRAFRIVVQGSAYLLRINTRPGDMPRHFTCMRAAADAGLAPRVRYACADDRISITDFVETVPLPAQDALARIPAALRTLHALPPFPGAPFNTTCTFLLNKGPALDGFLQTFRASGILPENETGELLARYRQVAAVYSRLDSDLAPGHNDLFKPDNMLFDGKRLWLVDWEAAFENDRYADLAVVANMIVTSESEESIYLREYFGEPPDEYRRARFHLMRQLAHMFYAMAFLTLGSLGKAIDLSEPVPAYSDFQRRFWARAVSLADNQAKTLYGRVHWEQVSQNMRQARFDEALRIVSDRNTIQERTRILLPGTP
ncbi:MAG TPA: phosphotransferase [Bryobacteraceae bacterium]|nr:phosphotransferase [Bryobacteraceae bacterium]